MPAIIGVRLETEALQTEPYETSEALRRSFKAPNVKLDLFRHANGDASCRACLVMEGLLRITLIK